MPRSLPAGRRSLHDALSPDGSTKRSRPQPPGPAHDGRWRTPVLSGQAGRHLRSGHAGYRRAADRRHQRGLPGQTRCSRSLIMAHIIGSISTSHVPAIGGALARQKQQDPYWKPFFDAYGKAREWLGRERPDVVVVVHNDHGLNFFLDKMPTFAVGAADVYRNADEGWGI